MPKKDQNQNPQNPVFSKDEWLNKIREKVGTQPWGTVVIKDTGALMVEVVRVGESDNLMLRIRTPNVKNALKLTRKEHIDALLELVNAISNNEKNLMDKLEALKEVFPKGGRTREEEEV